MVSNRQFADLINDVRETEELANDYLVPSSQAQMYNDSYFSFGNMEYKMRDVAHTQLATKLKIPNGFYNRMGEHEGLRTTVVNRLLPDLEKPAFVRTVGNEMRAYLSDRYKPISNLDVLNASAPVLRDMDVEVKSSSITEKRMYLQVVFPKMEGQVAVNDIVQYGLTISNSEVGYGMVKVSPTIWRLVCSNGLIRAAEVNHRHIGKQMEMGEDYTVFSDEAKIADRQAFFLKLRDTIQASVNEAKFDVWLQQMRGAAATPVKDLVKTVSKITKQFNISDSLNDFVVNNVANEGTMSKWGVINGITAIAHNTEDRDLQYHVETVGSALLDMTEAQWSRVAA